MENNNKDFLNEDYSFKKWFQIMWQNFYIQLFLIAIAFLLIVIWQVNNFNSLGGFITMLCLPIAIMIIIAYKGFYQFWNDLKNGNTR